VGNGGIVARTLDAWRDPAVLATSPPKATLAHKWCGPKPLTALPLTLPADVTTTSLPSHHLVPLRHDKASHPDDVIQPKSARKPRESQILLKSQGNVIFAHFSL